MNADNIHGVIVPVVTPINDKEEIDQKALHGIIERLIKAEVNGIFMGGSAGEGLCFQFTNGLINAKDF